MYVIVYALAAKAVEHRSVAAGYAAVQITPELLASLTDDERAALSTCPGLVEDHHETQRLLAAVRALGAPTSPTGASRNSAPNRIHVAECDTADLDGLLAHLRARAAIRQQARKAEEAEREQRRAAAEVARAEIAAYLDTLTAEERALCAACTTVDGCRSRVESHRAEQRWAAERRAAAAVRDAWIREHGSAHLRDLLDLDLGRDSQYRLERLELERPGWQFRPSEWSDDDPQSPPPQAVALLREARKIDPEAELRHLRGEGRTFFVRGRVSWLPDEARFHVVLGPIPIPCVQ